jgi:hypothetical protein
MVLTAYLPRRRVFGALFGRAETEAVEAVPITNPVPGTLARVVPGKGPFPTLGPPSAGTFS